MKLGVLLFLGSFVKMPVLPDGPWWFAGMGFSLGAWGGEGMLEGGQQRHRRQPQAHSATPISVPSPALPPLAGLVLSVPFAVEAASPADLPRRWAERGMIQSTSCIL